MKQAAYTLIEVLVVTTIILLLAGGGIAGFITFNRKQKVVTSAKELQTYLRTAQTLARVGEQPEGCDQLNGYLLRTSDAGDLKQVEILAACSNGQVAYKTYTLSDGVTLDQNLEMTFLGLHGGVTGAETIQVTNQAGSDTYQFEVTQGGEITNGELL